MMISIIGLGLIGASFAKAIKAKTDHKVTGFDINIDVLNSAIDDKTIDFIGNDELLSQSDMVIVSLYPSATIDFVKQNADKFKIDPDHIYIIGYSMGGFCAMNLLARGAKVKGAVLLSPCDLGSRYINKPARYQVTIDAQKGGYFRTPDEDYMDNDVREHAEQWQFPVLASQIDANLPIRFVGGAEDVTTPSPIHIPTLILSE